MGAAEIDRGDARRIVDQVGQDVAAARGDGHDVVVRAHLQRLEIDLGILPDLGVHQAMEEALEQPLQEPFPAQRPVASHRLLETQISIGLRIAQSRDSKLQPTLPTYCVSVPVS